MTILNPTQIETADYGVPGWVHIFNKNFDLLNSVLLKVNALGDVDTSYLPEDGILTWNAATGKWKLKVYTSGL
jgi:hypothetical protein